MLLRTVGPLLFAVTLTAGCTGDRLGGPTGDTGFDTQACPRPYDGPVRITEARVSCESDDTVRFYARTQGWTSEVTLFAQETGVDGAQRAEQHELVSFKFGACEDFDLLENQVTTGSPMWEPNITSEFSCEQNDDGSYVNFGDPETGGVMSYIMRAYTVDGEFASCLAFGHDPQGLLDGDYDDRRAGGVGPDRPDELSSCTIGEYPVSADG